MVCLLFAGMCLDVDIRQFPDGDNSRVGSKGISLNGGQKQRLVCVNVSVF
jgi:ABC-type bacteriocin/lantibiotic exporter with double-glycine peptidase domain